jgi:hypothetical protein
MPETDQRVINVRKFSDRKFKTAILRKLEEENEDIFHTLTGKFNKKIEAIFKNQV